MRETGRSHSRVTFVIHGLPKWPQLPSPTNEWLRRVCCEGHGVRPLGVIFGLPPCSGLSEKRPTGPLFLGDPVTPAPLRTARWERTRSRVGVATAPHPRLPPRFPVPPIPSAGLASHPRAHAQRPSLSSALASSARLIFLPHTSLAILLGLNFVVTESSFLSRHSRRHSASRSSGPAAPSFLILGGSRL